MFGLFREYKEFFDLLNRYKMFIRNPSDLDDFDPDLCEITIYFGLPGAGKSTYASYLAYHTMKNNQAVFSNFPITGAFKLDALNDLGVYDVSNGRVIIDEAGIEFNNRNFKAMPQRLIEFLKLHRHHMCAVDVFSQSPEDMDITFRRLAYKVFWIRKSILPRFIYLTPVEKTFDTVNGELITALKINRSFFARKYVYCPRYWKMFNTLSRPVLPKKDWSVY